MAASSPVSGYSVTCWNSSSAIKHSLSEIFRYSKISLNVFSACCGLKSSDTCGEPEIGLVHVAGREQIQIYTDGIRIALIYVIKDVMYQSGLTHASRTHECDIATRILSTAPFVLHLLCYKDKDYFIIWYYFFIKKRDYYDFDSAKIIFLLILYKQIIFFYG